MKTLRSLASDERRVWRLPLQPGPLPCSFSSSHGTGWDSAGAPQGKQDLAGRARAWLGKDRRSLSSKQGSHFGAPPPEPPREVGRGGAGLPGPLRATALGSRAGIPRAAYRTS